MILYYFSYMAPRRPYKPFLGCSSIFTPGAVKSAIDAIHRGMVGYDIHMKWPLFRTLFMEKWGSVDIARG